MNKVDKKKAALEKALDGGGGPEKLRKNEQPVKVQFIKIADLKEWADNPRDNAEAAERLAPLIQQYGFVDPVVVTPDYTIRAGHTRVMAARRLGMNTVPCIVVDFKNKEAAVKFSLAHNRSSEWAKWDHSKVQKIFGDFKLKTDVAALQTGFTKNEVQTLFDLNKQEKQFHGEAGAGAGSDDAARAVVSGRVADALDLAAQTVRELTDDEKMEQAGVLFILVPPSPRVRIELVRLYGKTDRELDWHKLNAVLKISEKDVEAKPAGTKVKKEKAKKAKPKGKIK